MQHKQSPKIFPLKCHFVFAFASKWGTKSGPKPEGLDESTVVMLHKKG